jgi:succinate dehydrogenase/fumarate reductase flavoprotein subunit
MSKKNNITRREFFKDAAIAGAAVAATTVFSAAPTEAAASIPKRWDKAVDVVVVGYGDAGASVAITAADAGAKVLIIEKAPQGEEGGNSRVAGNLWFNPSPADKAIIYMKAMAKGMVIPDDMLAVWADEMGKNADWVKSIGGNPTLAQPQSAFCSPEFPDFPGAESSKTYFATPGGWGQERLWKVLQAAVNKRGIEVLFATPAKDLVQDPKTSDIVGVIADQGGKPLAIKAKRAVVMTCGGYENNPQMMRDYNAVPEVAPFGTPYNTGDGIKMALKVGANLWHMSAQSGMWASFKVPDTDFGLITFPFTAREGGKPVGGYIYVDENGNRYYDESAPAHHGYMHLNSVWRPTPVPVPAYLIMDDKTRAAGSPFNLARVMGWAGVVKKIQFSKDNSDEVAKGWFQKADTIAELASKINLNPANLQKTVEKWNETCEKGVDAEFGRAATNLGPIQQGPFYAMRLTLGILNTQGGPKRNVKAQIVDPDDRPIPRLYSAGELGSMYSYLYNGGGNIGECLAFGRIAGRNAAAEKSWK